MNHHWEKHGCVFKLFYEDWKIRIASECVGTFKRWAEVLVIILQLLSCRNFIKPKKFPVKNSRGGGIETFSGREAQFGWRRSVCACPTGGWMASLLPGSWRCPAVVLSGLEVLCSPSTAPLPPCKLKAHGAGLGDVCLWAPTIRSRCVEGIFCSSSWRWFPAKRTVDCGIKGVSNKHEYLPQKSRVEVCRIQILHLCSGAEKCGRSLQVLCQKLSMLWVKERNVLLLRRWGSAGFSLPTKHGRSDLCYMEPLSKILSVTNI